MAAKVLVVMGFVLALASCGGQPAEDVRVTIAPQEAEVQVGCTALYTATVTGNTANRFVTFAILEPDGGTFEYTRATSNSIFYHPPATTGTFHIVARANADPSQQATALAHVVSGSGSGC
jgi:chitinase